MPSRYQLTARRTGTHRDRSGSGIYCQVWRNLRSRRYYATAMNLRTTDDIVAIIILFQERELRRGQGRENFHLLKRGMII